MPATLLALLALGAWSVAAAWAQPSVIVSNPIDASSISNQVPAIEGETSDLLLDEVVVNVYAGASTSGPAVQTLTALPNLGAWSTGPVQTLSDGLYTVVASQEESFTEETGTSAPIRFTVDTQAPAVTLNEPASPTNDASPSFSGKAGVEAGDVAVVELSVYAGQTASGTPLRTIPIVPDGSSWESGPISALGDGTYTVQAEQSDEAGNVAFSTPSTFTLDTVAPAVTLTAPLEGSSSNDSSPTVEGSAGTAAGDLQSITVELFAGASIGAQSPGATLVVQAAGGHWTAKFEHVGDGTYTVRAEQSDQAGNTGKSATSAFVLDTVAPTPTLTAPVSPSADTTPSFSGQASTAGGDVAQVKLNVYSGTSAGGSPVRSLTVTASAGGWSAGPLAALPDGTYTAQAEQSDQAGNTGKSAPATFRIDTVGPQVTLTSPTSASFTKSTSPHVEGSAGTAEGDLHGVTVELFAGASVGGQSPEVTVVVQASGGHWSATLGGLSEGTYTVRATQADSAGNTGQSTPVTFTVDTTAPNVSLTPVTSPSTDTTPSFKGEAGTATGDLASIKVKVYTGNNATGTPLQTLQSTASGSSWSTGQASALSEGTYTAQAEQSDQAGNTGKSATSKFLVRIKGPKVTLTPVAQFVNTRTPTFSGQAGIATGDLPSVTVKTYEGGLATGTPLRTEQVTPTGSSWSLEPSEPLPDGTYTVQAEQSDELHDSIDSDPSTFTVDTVAPLVTMAAVPTPGSDPTPALTGLAATGASDVKAVTVKLYAGEGIAGAVVQTVQASVAAGGTWSAAPAAALGDGIYTAQASQSDRAGNVGKSTPVTFTVYTPSPAPAETATTQPPASAPPDSPPAASFTWLPATPKTGESIALVSNSTDPSSPLASFAWSVGGAAFQPSGPSLTTAFATAGEHTVRLRVTAADGLSSTVSETIPVLSARATLMQPFPTVRIAGSDSSKGVRIKLLSVQAPAGAKVNVKCRGRGCPSKSESRTASAGGVGLTGVEFRRFERALRAGIVLEIRVSKPGQIGKYTRFRIRRNKLPQRLDTCLSASGVHPTKCPSS